MLGSQGGQGLLVFHCEGKIKRRISYRSVHVTLELTFLSVTVVCVGSWARSQLRASYPSTNLLLPSYLSIHEYI